MNTTANTSNDSKPEERKMRIKKVTIENFRGFSKETTINFNQLNLFIGKNDVGKSTVLEALDIFFNDGKGAVKIDAQDKNIHHQDNDISITVSFSGYPEEVIIDSTNKTSLDAEYLLNSDGNLEIKKVYTGSPTKASTCYIVAMHPTCELGKDLLLKKIKDLQKIVNDNEWECADKTKSAELRKTIWKNCCDSEDLKLEKTDIPTKKIEEGAREFWEKVEKFMPLYALFQSDRENKDGDSEIQDPIKFAVKQILQGEKLQNELENIAQTVKEQIKEVIDDTLEKLKDMSPEIAKNLKAGILETSQLKWADVFKGISINDDDGIPLNKRGSGVKRLVLLSFFRAEAERKKKGDKNNNIVYAMEEPETSQHPEHQEILIETFETLSKDYQVLLTTHSPVIVQLLAEGSYDVKLAKKIYDINLILVTKKDGKVSIRTGDQLSQNELALKHISANEISFLAFDGYVNKEFHTELYSFIENEYNPFFRKEINKHYGPEDLSESIKKYYNEKEKKDEYITIHKYIRHQIHHPPKDDTNPKYTPEQLRKSIEQMRKWLLVSD